MRKSKHVFWELVLILSSVLVFRGVWHLLDKLPFGNSLGFLWVSVVLGSILMAEGYLKLVHSDKNNHH